MELNIEFEISPIDCRGVSLFTFQLMDTNGSPRLHVDNSEVVVLSSGDEDELQNSHEEDSNDVAFLDGDNDDVDNDESIDSDCEIMSVEDLRGEEKWRDIQRPYERLNSLIQAGFSDPRMLLVRVFGMDEDSLPSDPNHLLSLLLTILAEPTPRHRLRHINSLDNVLALLATSTSILVITGAGISVSCGIPDFRSRDGIYARLARDFPDLSSPQAMFDMAYFTKNPVPFFKFAKELFPGQFTPSITHRLIALLESKGKLLRNYTQNIDTLEQAAGITRLIQCHGSFATATCTTCKLKVSCDSIKDAVFAQSIPRCTNCWPPKSITPEPSHEVNDSESTTNSSNLSAVDENSNSNYTPHDAASKVSSAKDEESRRKASYGVLKPDIVFFGEGLSSEFHDSLAYDVKETDLVLVMGSSLKVRPVAHIPNAVPSEIPQILINREPLSNHDFDVELLGDCDVIVSELCHRLGWEIPGVTNYTPLVEVPLNSLKNPSELPKSIPKSPDASQSNPTTGSITPTEFPSDESHADNEIQSTETIADSDEVSNAEKSSDVIAQDSSEGHTAIEVSENEDKNCVWEVASHLPPGTYTYICPNQYVFHGAEIYLEGKPGEMIISCSSSDVTSSHTSQLSPCTLFSGHEEEEEVDNEEEECASSETTDSENCSIQSSEFRRCLKRQNSPDRGPSAKRPRSL
uniref:protein acetyllysine N-acetyltransferase n=2 Tax=Trichobilharzia regenti TaxID=157069 RepID=A0AA85JIA4_TRIRE|nr:unnamed protein product [Trichobilharzia regenti]